MFWRESISPPCLGHFTGGPKIKKWFFCTPPNNFGQKMLLFLQNWALESLKPLEKLCFLGFNFPPLKGNCPFSPFFPFGGFGVSLFFFLSVVVAKAYAAVPVACIMHLG